MIDDTKLQHDVQAALEWEPSLDASKIGVTAKESVVTLTGTVANYNNKVTAERAAKKVYGVRGVANDIEVAVPGSIWQADSDLASAAVQALKWQATVPSERIKLTVRQSWVTLEGEVDWQYQRETAERTVRGLTGVVGVTNAIKLKPHAKAIDVKHKIEEAYRRSAELDARRVSVEAVDGKVILRGNVRSWLERDEAQHAAWSAPGVTEVENLLSVTP